MSNGREASNVTQDLTAHHGNCCFGAAGVSWWRSAQLTALKQRFHIAPDPKIAWVPDPYTRRRAAQIRVADVDYLLLIGAGLGIPNMPIKIKKPETIEQFIRGLQHAVEPATPESVPGAYPDRLEVHFKVQGDKRREPEVFAFLVNSLSRTYGPAFNNALRTVAKNLAEHELSY